MSPLSAEQETALHHHTSYWIEQARQLTGSEIPDLPVLLNLGGSAAGQYRSGNDPCIRYNPFIAALAFEDFICRTVPHEVPHYVVDKLFRSKRPKPHGQEWQDLMRAFGLEPSVCHSYDLSAVPVRRQRRYLYACDCREHQLSATRHNRIQRREATYSCARCGSELSVRPRI